MDENHVLAQFVTYRPTNDGQRDQQAFNVAYIMDVKTFKPILRVESSFTLSRPVQVSATDFIFCEKGPAGKIYFVSTKQK